MCQEIRDLVRRTMQSFSGQLVDGMDGLGFHKPSITKPFDHIKPTLITHGLAFNHDRCWKK
jgi:hypothetical protein